MGEDTKKELQMIAKNSGVSIGLGITLAVFIFFGGLTLGELKANLKAHERLNQVEYADMKADIQEIKATQKEILREVKK